MPVSAERIAATTQGLNTVGGMVASAFATQALGPIGILAAFGFGLARTFGGKSGPSRPERLQALSSAVGKPVFTDLGTKTCKPSGRGLGTTNLVAYPDRRPLETIMSRACIRDAKIREERFVQPRLAGKFIGRKARSIRRKLFSTADSRRERIETAEKVYEEGISYSEAIRRIAIRGATPAPARSRELVQVKVSKEKTPMVPMFLSSLLSGIGSVLGEVGRAALPVLVQAGVGRLQQAIAPSPSPAVQLASRVANLDLSVARTNATAARFIAVDRAPANTQACQRATFGQACRSFPGDRRGDLTRLPTATSMQRDALQRRVMCAR